MANLTQELIQNIDSALYLWDAITLKELIEFYPIEKMAEVYTYLQIACNSPTHEIGMEEEMIVIKDPSAEQISEITMQKVIFRRQEASLSDPAKKSGRHNEFSNVSKLKVRHVSLVA